MGGDRTTLDIATAGYRQTQVEIQLINKVSSIYQEWPILRTPKGYNLIAIDFALRKFTEFADAINSFGEFFSKASDVRPLRKDDDLLQSMLLKNDFKEGNITCFFLIEYVNTHESKSLTVCKYFYR